MRRRWSGCVHPWPGAEGEELPRYRQTAQLGSAGWLPDRLVGQYRESCGPAEDGLRYFYGNCTNQGLLEGQERDVFLPSLCIWEAVKLLKHMLFYVFFLYVFKKAHLDQFCQHNFLSASLEALFIMIHWFNLCLWPQFFSHKNPVSVTWQRRKNEKAWLSFETT